MRQKAEGVRRLTPIEIEVSYMRHPWMPLGGAVAMEGFTLSGFGCVLCVRVDPHEY